jgi:hypothetical protein
MSGDAHVQFWEGLGVRLPGATQHRGACSEQVEHALRLCLPGLG